MRLGYYGKEFSKELNLTTATISYPVNALLKIGFIKAEEDANKVYYSIDGDRILAYLDDIKDCFTKQSGYSYSIILSLVLTDI